MFKKLLYVLLLAAATVSCKKNEPAPDVQPVLPEISNIQPKDPKPGDVVTVTGKGFGTVTTDISLSIGSKVISINTVNDTEIRFTLPEGISEGLLSLIIKNIAAVLKDPAGAQIRPKPATQAVPIFQLIDANKGKVGDLVTLTGINFSTVIAENKVTFTSSAAGGLVTAVVSSATSTVLKVEVPTGTITGLVAIEVKGVSAVRPGTFNGIFTIETPPQTDISGTIAYFDKLKTHAYFAANDDQGNLFTINPTGVGHRFYKIIRINAAGTVTKTFEPSEFVSGATQLFVNGITNDADGTIWVLAGLSKTSIGKLYKIVRNSDVPVYVRDITGGDLQGMDVAQHFFDFVVNSKKEVFFIDANYKIYHVAADGLIKLYINPWELITGKVLSAIGLSIDAQDNLFFAAINGPAKLNNLYKVSPAKVITPIYQSTEYGFADGAVAQSKFQQLGSIAVNQAGTSLYIADGHGFRLRKLDIGSGMVTTLAGNGAPITTSSKMEGPALESVVGPAKISLSETRREIYLQNGSDFIYQIYRY
ncbi:MAG: IPT/TIG domain-containing protein [Bacteroidota bacterium]